MQINSKWMTLNIDPDTLWKMGLVDNYMKAEQTRICFTKYDIKRSLT